MSKIIALDDDTTTLAQCVREVEAGEEIVITRAGRPVARLSPVGAGERPSERRVALEGLISIMDHGWKLERVPFDRDALHER